MHVMLPLPAFRAEPRTPKEAATASGGDQTLCHLCHLAALSLCASLPSSWGGWNRSFVSSWLADLLVRAQLEYLAQRGPLLPWGSRAVTAHQSHVSEALVEDSQLLGSIGRQAGGLAKPVLAFCLCTQPCLLSMVLAPAPSLGPLQGADHQLLPSFRGLGGVQHIGMLLFL